MLTPHWRTHMTADHDMGDLVVNAHGQNKVAGLALRLAHQVAAILALVLQQLLCILPRDVAMEPPVACSGLSFNAAEDTSQAFNSH